MRHISSYSSELICSKWKFEWDNNKIITFDLASSNLTTDRSHGTVVNSHDSTTCPSSPQNNRDSICRTDYPAMSNHITVFSLASSQHCKLLFQSVKSLFQIVKWMSSIYLCIYNRAYTTNDWSFEIPLLLFKCILRVWIRFRC